MDASPTDKDCSVAWWLGAIGFPPEEDGPPEVSGDPGGVPSAPVEVLPREIDFGLGPVEADLRRGVGLRGRPAWDRRILVDDSWAVLTRSPADPASGRDRIDEWEDVATLSALCAAARAACGPAAAEAGRDRAGSTAA